MRLEDRFDLGAEIGRGACGVVHVGVDRTTGTSVAIKLLRPPGRAGPRFLREARILAALSHPAVVGYVAHGATHDGTLFLATQWLDGEDLAKRLRRGELTLGEAVWVGRRVASALAAAHAQGVIHRDVKPANVVLVGGRADHAVLVDFGVARVREGTVIGTQTGAMLGTPNYMAPEQLRGASDAVVESDLYSLGCLLYRLLCGQTPFQADDLLTLAAMILTEDVTPIPTLAPATPPALVALVGKLLARAGEDRPRSAEGVERQLAQIQSELGSEAALDDPIAGVAVPRGDPADDRVQRLVAAANEALNRDQLDEASALAKEGIALEPRGIELATLLYVRAQIELRIGPSELALELADRAAAALGGEDPDFELRIQRIAIARAQRLGDGASLIFVFQRVVAIAARASLADAVRTLGGFAHVYRFVGLGDRVADVVAAMEARCDGEAEIPPAVSAHLKSARVQLALVEGRADRAAEQLGEAIEESAAGGDEYASNQYRANLASLLLRLGRGAESEALSRSVIITAERLRNRPAQLVGLINLSRALLLGGRAEEARAASDDAVKLSLELGDRRALSTARAYRASAAMAKGDFLAAIEDAAAALDSAAARGPRALAAAVLCDAHRAAGDLERAVAVARGALADAPIPWETCENELDLRVALVEALLVTPGGAAEAKTRIDEAAEKLRASVKPLATETTRRHVLDGIPLHVRVLELQGRLSVAP